MPHGSGHVAQGRTRHVGSASRVSPGMPRMGARDQRDPLSVTRTRQDGRRGTGVAAPGRVAPHVCMRPLLAPGAWQGGAMTTVAQQGSMIQVMARYFGSSPHPSPGAYKRRIAKPSVLCSFFAYLSHRHLRLLASPPPSPLCSAFQSTSC